VAKMIFESWQQGISVNSRADIDVPAADTDSGQGKLTMPGVGDKRGKSVSLHGPK